MSTLSLTDPGALIPAILGVAGFLLYAGADMALCVGRITSAGLSYYTLNAAAALLIGISLLYSFNLGAFLTEALCLATSLTAIALRLRQAGRLGPDPTGAAQPGARPFAPSGPRAMPSRRIGPGHGLRPDRVA